MPLEGRVIYYTGPVDAVRDEIIGPAGPTTANRMDPFLDMMLAQGGIWLRSARANEDLRR